DIFMPVRNGYELCDLIKLDPRYTHVPVVLLVGAFDPLDQKEAQRVRADGVLKKPFVPADPLVNMVKDLLAKAAGARAATSATTAPVGAPPAAANGKPAAKSPASASPAPPKEEATAAIPDLPEIESPFVLDDPLGAARQSEKAESITGTG